MYPQRISHSFGSYHHNLKNLVENSHHHFKKYALMFHQKIYNKKNVKQVNRKLQEFFRNGMMYQMFLQCPRSPKMQSNKLLQVWAHHCECVIAQRFRRCQQMFCLYSKWWEERALKDFIKRMRQTLARKSKELALSAIGVSYYNWDENRIPDEYIKKHLNELEYITALKENTICLSCDPTSRTNINTSICKCGTSGKLSNKSYDNWTPFIEKNDLIVWKRLHPSGQNEYKVYGSYNDVAAEDFLNVQIDTDYRKTWDTTAVALEVAERDPSPNSNSDIIYWEMLWPRLFVNRDYVFNRRFMVDTESNMLFIVSKSTEHPNFPKYPEKFRIEDYWSCMVIKPYTDMKAPGLEFSLTYFDNPGVNIPSSVTNWVAMKAMPDFLERLREATKKYKDYCLREGVSETCKILREEERLKEEMRQKDKLDYCAFTPSENIKLKATHPQSSIENKKSKTDSSGLISSNMNKPININSSELNTASSSTAVQTDNTNFWKYLHPMYYFH